MTVHRSILGNCFAVLSLVSWAIPADAADFYQGKTITIVVGSSPGGGFDTLVRSVARHIGDYIPGRPSVIVQNLPGAGGLKAVRSLDVGPKDGTVMTHFNPGLIIGSILEPEQIKVNFTQYGWVGVVSSTFLVCYGYGPNGIRNWDDLMNRKQVALGATGRGADTYLAGVILGEIFHAHTKVVLGFPGASQRQLALERGELDGDCSTSGAIRADWLRDGQAHMFVRFSERRAPEMPESVPYIVTLAKQPADKELISLLFAADDKLGRPFIMSGEVPQERLAEMRNAFTALMNDPGFRQEMEKVRIPVFPVSGAAAQDFIGKLSAAPPDLVARAKRIFQ